jgi:hypothetical protein
MSKNILKPKPFLDEDQDSTITEMENSFLQETTFNSDID